MWVKINTAAKTVGLCRARLYTLLKEADGEIKTVLLKNPTSRGERGARLIHLPSLLEYFDNLAKA